MIPSNLTQLRAGFLTAVLPFVLVSAASLIGAPDAEAAITASPAEGEPARVTFQTEDKLTLVGSFYAPKPSKQKAPGAVLVHDAGRSREDLANIATRLQKSGFAVLTLDLRGHGESATPELAWSKLDAEAQKRSWAFMPRDVKAGVEFLTGQANVHSTTVSLVGQGAGCTLAARHATRDDKVRSLVLILPQAEQLGFVLSSDLEALAGLPMLIAVGKDQASTAKRLSEGVARAGGGESAIETSVSKIESAQLLDDTKLAGDLARWMQSKALPGAGKAAIDAKSGRKD